MTPILVSGPAVEPVALADMKAFLRLDGTEEDSLVTALIGAARLTVEAASGRLLVHQTWRLVLDRWPRGGVLRVPLAPFAGLIAARVFDAAGAATTLPPASFAVDTAADPGRIVVAAAVPDPGRQLAGIELDVRGGYGPGADDVPPPLRQAVRLLVAYWFEHRGDEPAAPGRALPADVVALVATYRRARL